MTPWTVASQASLSMGILQARILEWVAMPSSRGSSQSNRGLLHCRQLRCHLNHQGMVLMFCFFPYSTSISFSLLLHLPLYCLVLWLEKSIYLKSATRTFQGGILWDPAFLVIMGPVPHPPHVGLVSLVVGRHSSTLGCR